jgi:programmed cell death protein 5
MSVSSDDELTALRAQSLQAMQQQIEQQAANQLQAEEQAQHEAETSASIDALLRRHLSPEARSRLTRIGLVDAERVKSIKAELVGLFQSGAVSSPMSDASLKQILAKQSKSRSNASIRRI